MKAEFLVYLSICHMGYFVYMQLHLIHTSYTKECDQWIGFIFLVFGASMMYVLTPESSKASKNGDLQISPTICSVLKRNRAPPYINANIVYLISVVTLQDEK
jgi:putative Mn2+ efflux pump MntP